MAEIYLALSRGTADFTKLVVQKRIWPELANDPDFVAMFLDEGRLAVRLHHPNVVQTYEVGEEDGRYYLAMEYLEGQPMHHVLNRLHPEGGPSLALWLRILIDVLAGLDYAHELTDFDGTPLGVVHRDVCPQNVFITYEGHVKLVDFGIAKTLTASHHTRPGVLKGRLAYMAPEQLRGGMVDRRADVFSIGVMLWEALSRRRMWQSLTEASIVRQLVSGAPIPPPTRTHAWPEELASICARALRLEASERYSSAADMQRDLERVLVGMVDSHARDLGHVVSTAFTSERAEMRKVIDKHLRAHREGRAEPIDRTSSSYPKIERPSRLGDRSSAPPSEVSALGRIITPTAADTISLFTSRRRPRLRSAILIGVLAASAIVAGHFALGGGVNHPEPVQDATHAGSPSPATPLQAVALEPEASSAGSRLSEKSRLRPPSVARAGEAERHDEEPADRPAKSTRRERRSAQASSSREVSDARALPVSAPAPDVFDVALEDPRRRSPERPIDTELPYGE